MGAASKGQDMARIEDSVIMVQGTRWGPLEEGLAIGDKIEAPINFSEIPTATNVEMKIIGTGTRTMKEKIRVEATKTEILK